MIMKPVVKVIKRHLKEGLGETVNLRAQQPAARRHSSPDLTREVVSTVTAWVSEFQRRQYSKGEPKQIFSNLFEEPLPHPSKP